LDQASPATITRYVLYKKDIEQEDHSRLAVKLPEASTATGAIGGKALVSLRKERS